jgi:coproporphyrinogen III oxidase
MDKQLIASRLEQLQDSICNGLLELDKTASIQEDLWQRPGGGGGRTRAISGQHIEKGGVNFSAVHGTLSPEAAKSLGIVAGDFFATGVSIVLHPANPWVSIIHMNVRYFEAGDSWWFGGGIDASPHYISMEEASGFHNKLKHCCDLVNTSFYPRFKKWADDYFYIKHRHETRGIGGIFFDRLTDPEISKSAGLDFILGVGQTFLPAYTDLFSPNVDKPFNDDHKNWQLIRRGRYVEFNLAWDRGTRFGLETDGRAESILMSLPHDARWVYNYVPQTGSLEEQTQQLLKKDIDWVSMSMP